MAALAWLQLAAAVLCLVAAALLWALLRDRRVRDLQGQVDALRELAPIRIREFLLRSKADLRAFVDLLEPLEDEAMRPELRRLRHQCDYPDVFLVKIPRVDPEGIARLAAQYEAACRARGAAPSPRAADLARVLRDDYRYGLDRTALFSATPVSREAGAADVWQRPDNGE